MRTLITPGRLYAQLAAEFRQCCCGECTHCVVPLPFPIDAHGRGPNWAIGPLPRECESCRQLIDDLTRRYQSQYDLLDPFSRPLLVHAPHRPDLRPH